MAFKRMSLDTNVILRLILNDVPEQAEKAKELLSAPGAYFYVSDQVVTEVAFVLGGPRYGFSRSMVVRGLNAVLNGERMEYNEPVFTKVFFDYLTHPKLSFNDCYIARTMEQMGRTPLWTFDQKFAKQMDDVVKEIK